MSALLKTEFARSTAKAWRKWRWMLESKVLPQPPFLLGSISIKPKETIILSDRWLNSW
ncbi:hypothetical protein [Scytonema sp. NUACC26]|uniref:hypothetical protein n=1 Tax=Scytonema sp. NUACC26 TaxID=3140176 RepID=UPI0038B3BE29